LALGKTDKDNAKVMKVIPVSFGASKVIIPIKPNFHYNAYIFVGILAFAVLLAAWSTVLETC